MKKVRIAMLGCGAVAELYLPVFRLLKQGTLAAAVDTDRNALEFLAGKYQVPKIYKSVRDAANDSDIDAVVVGTPPHLHAEHIELFAAQGKHVLCEKPMASTVDDCRRIIDACDRNGVKLMMGHMKRFMRGNQKVKSIIDTGVLGKIFMVECHWDCAVPQLIGTYREQKVTAGGNFQDHGPHAFDLVRWWTGNDILEVSATVRSVHPGRPTEDTGIAVLEHEKGMFSYHHMTRISYGREHSQDTYRIYGTEGTLLVRNDHHFPTMSLESPEIVLYRPGNCVQRFETFHGWNVDDSMVINYPFYNQLSSFCECILDDSEPRVTGSDGMHVIGAVMGCYVSSLRGIKVKLPFEEQADLIQMFEELKRRDAETLGYDYTVNTAIREPISLEEHVLAHRPPRTKEKWSDTDHGLRGKAELSGLMGQLREVTSDASSGPHKTDLSRC